MIYFLVSLLVAASVCAAVVVLACCIISGIVDRDTFPTTQPELGE